MTLQDAITASAKNASALGSAVGYRFDNDVVVGEYWPNDDITPEKFLSEFEREIGTLPEVVGLLTIRSMPLEEALNGVASDTLRLDAPVFTAPPVAKLPDSKAEAHRRMVSEAKENSVSISGATVLAAGSTAMPRNAVVQVTTSQAFANTINVHQFYHWIGTDPFSSPLNTPNHWGMEFGIDLTTELPQYQFGLRPDCWPGYEEATAATNDNITWWVYVTDGTQYFGAPGPIGFYADYVDAFDECARTSIAIGAADPTYMPWNPYDGSSTLDITILATKGNEPQSRVSGAVQILERYSCEAIPNVPLSACMGLNENIVYPGPGAQSQLTKNASTVWYAPDRCWHTPDFGSAAIGLPCP